MTAKNKKQSTLKPSIAQPTTKTMLTESAFEELRKKPLSKMTGTELKALADNWTKYAKPEIQTTIRDDGVFRQELRMMTTADQAEFYGDETKWIPIQSPKDHPGCVPTLRDGKPYRVRMPFDSKEYLNAEWWRGALEQSKAYVDEAERKFQEADKAWRQRGVKVDCSLADKTFKTLDRKRTLALYAHQEAIAHRDSLTELWNAFKKKNIKQIVYWTHINTHLGMKMIFRSDSVPVLERQKGREKRTLTKEERAETVKRIKDEVCTDPAWREKPQPERYQEIIKRFYDETKKRISPSTLRRDLKAVQRLELEEAKKKAIEDAKKRELI